MNNEQKELLIDAFKRFLNETIKVEPLEAKERLINQLLNNKESQEEFINKCKTEDALSVKWIEEYGDLRYGSKEEIEHLSKHYKTDPEFSEKWGLKIEERELSDDERYDLCAAQKSKMSAISEEDYIKYNIPTKLITITYNDKKIESYV